MLKDILPLPQYKILVIGESCKDVYHYGRVERISPEAPVPIFNKQYSEIKEGMSKNVCLNLISLNQKYDLLTNNDNYEDTIRKERYIDNNFNKQVFRVDLNDKTNPLDLNKAKNIKFDEYDALIISDYNKGFIQPDDIKKIIKKNNLPVFVDSKKNNLECFNGCYLKINELEHNKLTNIVNKDKLIVTLGKKGAMYKNTIYSSFESKVFDTCGAGDTFIAALCVSYLKTKKIVKAIEFANLCAGISVKHLGNHSISQKDLYEEICN